MRKGKIAAYRRKSMVFGGLLGAGFGVVIGSMVGASLEAALTGFFGGLILGEMITYARRPPTRRQNIRVFPADVRYRPENGDDDASVLVRPRLVSDLRSGKALLCFGL